MFRTLADRIFDRRGVAGAISRAVVGDMPCGVTQALVFDVGGPGTSRCSIRRDERFTLRKLRASQRDASFGGTILRIGLSLITCQLALSACQIASSTHGGNGSSFAYPDRTALHETVRGRTLSIEEQIAMPQGPTVADTGKPLPAYEPFIYPSVPTPVRLVSLDATADVVGGLENAGRTLPILKPLPIVDIGSIREALVRSATQAPAPDPALAPLSSPVADNSSAGLF